MDTVFVGLSGGVDSAVSAYLLKKQGYKVVGAFIKGWEPDFLPCTGVRDRLEAMRVAAHLGIPFVTYDLSEEYKRGVVDYFVSEYKLGRTPNPDVMCNRVIKFGAFWEKAKADGADMIATGHYAMKKELPTSNFQLLVSKDKEKDQTYFLWTLTKDDLAHSLFPVGGLEKTAVRSLALEANLPNASRADSQGLCFLGHVDMHAFLKRYLPTEIGVVRDENGKSIGNHDGIWFYTLGQRHGFGSLGGERLYVVAKDRMKNELTVSTSSLGENAEKIFALTNESSVDGSPLVGKYLGRYRYRQTLLSVEIHDGQASFDTPQRIASGQSLVVYDQQGEIMHGGAIIE
ncbi:tRNA 2-thiouridine(34) synthase MnmA [Patescibacteria group bacterium]|nr:MAG: tRNA 2-thiouridine(34) synthase MnmA [Patescibacteria group bacterium]